jgi:hypothetical protein
LLHVDAEGERSPQTAKPAKPAEPPDRLRRSPACSRAKASRNVPAARKKKCRKRGSGADDGRRVATPVAICAGVRVVPVNSATREIAQPAEAAETVAPSQTGWGVPAAGEEMLPISGILAGAAAVATDEDGRSARIAAYQAQLADVKTRHHAQLAAVKQRLPSLEARLQELWQDVGGARRPAPTKVHLRATAAVDKQLEKAETLLRFALLWFAERHLEP